MYDPNNDTQNYNSWLKRLDTQLNEPINQNDVKFPKVVKPTNKKTLSDYCNEENVIRLL